jgi:hypothetical protein
MSKVQHQLLITLVHGTWGRGFFPQRQRRDRPPFWFEEGSLFLARLSTELGDIPHKVKPLLWSGANSIFERDKTAHALAEHLSTEHAEYPQAVQLAVAHSHGGNIALRALHHLQQRDSSQLGGADAANPLVVTLATPFIEIHQAHFGRRPLYVRVALMVFVLELFGTLFEEVLSKLFPAAADTNIWTVTYLVAGVTVFVLGWWWIARRAPARQNQLDALKNATRLGELTSAQRLFVIRAIDDEASLTLALGAILNYVTARSITYVLLLYLLQALMLIPVALSVPAWVTMALYSGFVAFGILALGIILFVMLMVSRSVHGRELAVSPMECQINTQSTPDGRGLSAIITLVRRTYVKSLRHGIYDHEDCAKAISDWVRSQLCAPPVR